MVHKLVVYEIEFCNSRCPYFCHNFEDNENIWCSKLDKKIGNNDGEIWFDQEKRLFPNDCPLESK